MVRGIAFLVGAAFTFVLAIALWGSVSGLISEPPAPTAEEEFHLHPKEAHLASDGIFGRFDRRQLQRGFQVQLLTPVRLGEPHWGRFLREPPFLFGLIE